MRKLQNGTEAEDLEFPVTLKVYTRCPEKYKLVDMETGEEYIGQWNQKKNWKRNKNA